MGIKDLISKAIKHEVNRENGIGEEVRYTHSKNRNYEIVRCIPEDIIFGEESRDKINNFVTFHGLELSEEPNNGDTIVWNGKRYNYEKTVTQIGTTYDVKASIKRHAGGRAR